MGAEHTAPEAEQRRRQMARFGALFFGAGALVTVLGLVADPQPQVDVLGLEIVAGASALVAAVLALWGELLPSWAWQVVLALGTALVSLALISNGERHGGAAGGDEMYYLWVIIFAAYFTGRLATAAQVVLVAAAYAGALVVVDPGEVATSRWLSTVGLVVGAAVVVRLLSERIECLVARLEAAAHTDSLTGLANRLAFEQAFWRESARSVRHGSSFALLLADLDQLKEINDRFGHQAGDDALRHVGHSLRDCMRASDFAARIGGDEFAVLMPRSDAAGAELLGERLARALCERGPTELALGLSYGVAVPATDGAALDDVMRAADEALYKAKAANGKPPGRGRRARRPPAPVASA